MVLHPYCPGSGQEDYEFGVCRVDSKVRLHHKKQIREERKREQEGEERLGYNTMLRVLSTPKHVRRTESNISKEQGWTRN